MPSVKGIDMHNHYLADNYLEMLKGGKLDNLVRLVEDAGKTKLKFNDPKTGKKTLIPFQKELYDHEVRQNDFKRQGIEKVVVAHVPFTQHGSHDAHMVKSLHESMNEDLATKVAADPEHVSGLANVPIQDVKLAIDELERVVTKLGLSGVQLGTNVNGIYFGDKSFFPFFEAAESLDAFILYHPSDVAGADSLTQFYARNLIGNPLDTTINANSIIFGGVFDQFPNVKIGLCHAGGMMPCLYGRWNHGYAVRPECSHLPKPPSEYLRSFYYDIITHSAPILRYLVSLVGADRVMLGTDYPFDMGLDDPVKVVLESGLEPDMINKLAWENAEKIFFSKGN